MKLFVFVCLTAVVLANSLLEGFLQSRGGVEWSRSKVQRGRPKTFYSLQEFLDHEEREDTLASDMFATCSAGLHVPKCKVITKIDVWKYPAQICACMEALRNNVKKCMLNGEYPHNIYSQLNCGSLLREKQRNGGSSILMSQTQESEVAESILRDTFETCNAGSNIPECRPGNLHAYELRCACMSILKDKTNCKIKGQSPQTIYSDLYCGESLHPGEDSTKWFNYVLKSRTQESEVADAYKECGAGVYNPMSCTTDGDCCGDDICQEKKNFMTQKVSKKCATPCYNYDYDNCQKTNTRKKDCLRGPVLSGGSNWWYQKPNTIYKVEGKCFKALTGCTGCLYDPSRHTKHLREIKSGCGAMCTGDKVYMDVGDSCSGGTRTYVKNPSGATKNRCCAREKIGMGSISGETKAAKTCCRSTPYLSDGGEKWCSEDEFTKLKIYIVGDGCIDSKQGGKYTVDPKGALDGQDKQGNAVKLGCCAYERLTVSYPERGSPDRTMKHGCCAAGEKSSTYGTECVKLAVEDDCMDAAGKDGVYVEAVDDKKRGPEHGIEKDVKLVCCTYERITVNYPQSGRGHGRPDLACCAAGETRSGDRKSCLKDILDEEETSAKENLDFFLDKNQENYGKILKIQEDRLVQEFCKNSPQSLLC